MRHHSVKISPFALGLLAMSSPFLLHPAVAQDRAVELLASQEERFANRNLVSALQPQSGSWFLDTMRAGAATRQADWARGDLKVGSLGETRLIAYTIPSWFRPRDKAPFEKYQGVLNEFLTRDIEFEGPLATLRGEFSLDAVTEAYLAPYRFAPKDILERQKIAGAALINEKDVKVQLHFGPSVAFYNEAGTYLGRTHYLGDRTTFKAQRVDPNGIATINWFKAPMLILPKLELTPTDAARSVTLTPQEGARTMQALMQALNEQGLKFAPLEDELGGIPLYIAQRKSWTAGELLKAVCAVGGFQVTSTAAGYTLAISPAHDSVANQLYPLVIGRHDQQETLKTVFAIYARNGHQLDLPFDRKLFMAQEPIRLDSLNEADQAKALAPLDEATRREVRQVWFVADMTLGVHGSQNGGSIGFSITPFPADYDLNPPATWKGFERNELLELYGAKIIP